MAAEEHEFVFVCPVCEASIRVNGAMKEALIERSCVLCGATVSTEDFSRAGAE